DGFVGDPAPIAAELPSTRRATEQLSTPAVEHEWAQAVVQRFERDGNRLSDVEAARLLVAVEDVETRDAIWSYMTKENVTSHHALWSDLTRRAPDEVRGTAATLAAFTSWSQGNGAQAYSALDRVPE